MSGSLPAARGVTKVREPARVLMLTLVTVLLLATFLFLEVSDLVSHTGGV